MKTYSLEIELIEDFARWIDAQGYNWRYELHSARSWAGPKADFVFRRPDGHLHAIEAKLNSWNDVVRQAIRNTDDYPFSSILYPRRPTNAQISDTQFQTFPKIGIYVPHARTEGDFVCIRQPTQVREQSNWWIERNWWIGRAGRAPSENEVNGEDEQLHSVNRAYILTPKWAEHQRLPWANPHYSGFFYERFTIEHYLTEEIHDPYSVLFAIPAANASAEDVGRSMDQWIENFMKGIPPRRVFVPYYGFGLSHYLIEWATAHEIPSFAVDFTGMWREVGNNPNFYVPSPHAVKMFIDASRASGYYGNDSDEVLEAYFKEKYQGPLFDHFIYLREIASEYKAGDLVTLFLPPWNWYHAGRTSFDLWKMLLRWLQRITWENPRELRWEF